LHSALPCGAAGVRVDKGIPLMVLSFMFASVICIARDCKRIRGISSGSSRAEKWPVLGKVIVWRSCGSCWT
jgi:hypothetical protein